MSLSSKIHSLVQRIAAEFKALRRDIGNPLDLTTTDRSSLVSAINEVRALIDATPGLNLIDDGNPSATGTTFSAAGIISRLDQLKADILGGADGAFDTLKELQDALANDSSGLAALTQALDARLRTDADQNLTLEAQAQARFNIGAISVEAVGDTEIDLVSVFAEALTPMPTDASFASALMEG
jgi:capsid protein